MENPAFRATENTEPDVQAQISTGKSDDGDGGEMHKRGEHGASTTESQSCGSILPPNTKTITRKAHKFTDLSQAHSAITSGAATRFIGRDISATSWTSRDVSTTILDAETSKEQSGLVDKPVSQMPSKLSLAPAPQHSDVLDKSQCLKPFHLSACYHPSQTGADRMREPPIPQNGVADSSRGFETDQSQSYGSPPEPSSVRFEESENTVDSVYKQYLPSNTVDPSSESSGFNLAIVKDQQTLPNGSESDQASATSIIATSDSVVLTSELGPEKSLFPNVRRNHQNPHPPGYRWHLYNAASSAPAAPLSPLPHLQIEQFPPQNNQSKSSLCRLSSAEPSTSTVHDSEELFAGQSSPTEAGSTVHGGGAHGLQSGRVQPLRLRSLKLEAGSPESFYSRGAVSGAGLSSGCMTTDSSEDPFRYDRLSFTRNVFVHPTREREVSAALRKVSSMSSKGTLATPDASPERDLDYSLLRLSQGTRHVMGQPRKESSAASHAKKGTHGRLDAFGRQRLPEPMSVTEPESPVAYRRIVSPVQKFGLTLGHMVSDPDDWETVATSRGAFDSNRAEKGTSFGSQMIKATGSSIADYSDHTSYRAPTTYDGFSSTDKILRHPSLSDSPSTGHDVRTIRGSGRPAMFPRQNTRWDGYVQESYRVLTNQAGPASEAESRKRSLMDKMTTSFRNPIRSGNPYTNLEKKSNKFDFRDSEWYDTQEAKDVRVQVKTIHRLSDKEKPESPRKRRAREAKERYSFSLLSTGEKDFIYPQPDTPGAVSPAQFNFPLIPLPEAARRQAMDRESGDVDQTFTYPRIVCSSISSAKKTGSTTRITPPTPSDFITKPKPVHPRKRKATNVPDADCDARIVRSASARRTGQRDGIVINTNTSHYISMSSTLDSNSLQSSESGPAPFSVRDTPHLYTREQRFRNPSRTVTPIYRFPGETASPETLNMQLSEDAWMTWRARKRCQTWFYAMCILCLIPFTAPLVYGGLLNSGLSWYTKGETDTLTRRQRKKLKVVGVVSLVAWICGITILVTLAVSRKIGV